MINSDPTTDPALATWVPSGERDFPIQNLPYGAFVRADEFGPPHLCVAIHDYVFDLHVAARAGLFDDVLPSAREALCAPVLNPLLARGHTAWRAVRERLCIVLDRRQRDVVAESARSALVRRSDVRMRLPLAVADYIDFYSSLEHATNIGKIFRPLGDPLPPNWRWMPLGYHGRSSTVVCGGTPVARPHGQRNDAGAPDFWPTGALDFELELAFVTGDGPAPPARLRGDRARDAIFGVALLNDWSARDIQAWEYQPLGPFLGKSFLTSLAPWIVSLDALEPYRVAGPLQDPPPLPYLAVGGAQTYDISLTVTLQSAKMREAGLPAQTLSRTNFRTMYWSMAQQLAHVGSNGTRIRAGDLYGSGTISGATPDAYGSLIELAWRGARPVALADGTSRAYLADGDEVVLYGVAAGEGRARVGLGSVSGMVRS